MATAPSFPTRSSRSGRRTPRGDTRIRTIISRKPLDPNFTGYGRAPTDDDGRFSIATVMPGRVPGPDDTLQAPHLLLEHSRARDSHASRHARVLRRRAVQCRRCRCSRWSPTLAAQTLIAKQRRRRSLSLRSRAAGRRRDGVLRCLSARDDSRRAVRRSRSRRRALRREPRRRDASRRGGARAGGGGDRSHPARAVDAIAQSADVDDYDLDALAREAANAGNLAIPLVQHLTERVGRVDARCRALRALGRDEPGHHR